MIGNSTDNRETDEFRLLRDLFNHYDKEARPVYNVSDVVNVEFSLSLIQIISVVSFSLKKPSKHSDPKVVL